MAKYKTRGDKASGICMSYFQYSGLREIPGQLLERYGLASKTMLKGVSVARRKCLNPPAVTASPIFF
jgi:hypothetical protein